SVRSLHVHVGHVMRLIEQSARLAPGALLVAPVRKLGRDHRKRVRPDLRVAQQLDRVTDGTQQVFQALVTHSCSYLPSIRIVVCLKPPETSAVSTPLGAGASRWAGRLGPAV